MSTPPSLVIPKDQLQGMKLWTPGALSSRPVRAERRAANQAEQPPQERRTAHSAQPGAELIAIEAARAALELDSARVEAERNAARRAGFTEGFEGGYAEGKALVDAHLARLQSLTAGMQTAMARFEEDVADDVTQLALDIARRVIRTELTVRSDALLPLVQEALRAVPEGGSAGEIRLHPDDIELVKTKLASELALGAWILLADPAIEAGGCRVITRQCDIDATLAVRWKRVMQSLGFADAWKPKP